MSRFEGEFQAAADGPIDLPELGRLSVDGALAKPPRQAAIACYLSASDGWRDAGQLLDGAFAGDPTRTAGDAGSNERG